MERSRGRGRDRLIEREVDGWKDRSIDWSIVRSVREKEREREREIPDTVTRKDIVN